MIVSGGAAMFGIDLDSDFCRCCENQHPVLRIDLEIPNEIALARRATECPFTECPLDDVPNSILCFAHFPNFSCGQFTQTARCLTCRLLLQRRLDLYRASRRTCCPSTALRTDAPSRPKSFGVALSRQASSWLNTFS